LHAIKIKTLQIAELAERLGDCCEFVSSQVKPCEAILLSNTSNHFDFIVRWRSSAQPAHATRKLTEKLSLPAELLRTKVETKTKTIVAYAEGEFNVSNVEAHGEREKFSFCEKISQDSLHKRRCTTIELAQPCIGIAFML
jgi:hypothetical protein